MTPPTAAHRVADIRGEVFPNGRCEPLSLVPEQLEQLADLIADRLAARAAGELIDAAELARRIGWTRERVYDHAEQLGAIRLGTGDRPRLAFRWPQALDGLTASSREVRSAKPESPVAAGGSARRRPRRLGTGADLLPIGGPGRPGSSRRGAGHAD